MTQPDPTAAPVEHQAGPNAPSLPTRRPWLKGRAQWAELIESPHTPAQWAIIGEAIRIADARARVHTDFGEPVVRGDEDWCQLALTALKSPVGATRAAQAPAQLPEYCWADLDLIRVWLNAPNAYNDAVVATVADTLNLVTWGQASNDATHRAAHTVLSAAQDAGVFGLDGHRIELHRLANSDGYDVGHLLVARPPFGSGVAGVPTDQLIPTSAATPVEGAVAVIAAAAAYIDATLAERDYAAAHPAPRHPRTGPGRPFPPQWTAAPVAGVMTPPPDAPPGGLTRADLASARGRHGR